MARGTFLSRPLGRARWLALCAAVLLVHALALQWLARELETPSLLRPLTTPMFTRVLEPAAVAAPPPP
ncbi:MAG TPA: hypothetical protein VLI46_15550, partial [Ramlibacter sp.]|nr:hypothetical protein [Ramlibacter sp.]